MCAAVAFTGERGVGKTWLLRHLAEIDLNRNGTQAVVGNSLSDSATGGISDVHSLYLSLQDWTDEPEAAAKALIIAVDEQISKWTTLKPTTLLGGGDTASLGDLSRWLEADVRSLLGDKTTALVLLLDHAHESPWYLLNLLDQHVLGPLTAIPQVFVVIAGRGKPYPWQAPDLRLHMELIEIRPFDVEQTRQQLKGQQEWALSEQEITEIWELSGGYPRTNYALGCLGRDRWREAIEGELQYMLEPVPEQHRQTVRECLEALCVLEGFRDEQVWPMLACYYQNPDYTGRPLSDAIVFREELRRYAFVRWDDTPPAIWRIYGRLRTLLVNWIKSDRELWVRMNCAAYSLFAHWANHYEKTRERWQAEAENHNRALEEVGASLADCPG